MKLAVIGTGYVGLVAGACLAETGHDVYCVDNDQSKIEMLNQGIIPIYEPGLKEIVDKSVNARRLSFTTDFAKAVQFADVIFIAVGTPSDEDGSADLQHVLAVAQQIGKFMNGYKVIVDKSTVPVGTADLVRKEISKFTSYPFDVVSNPEFLKEGAAVEDFLRPDRVVIGADSEQAKEIMQDLYAPFVRQGHPVITMDVKSAEITKYAANAFLATKISFINEMANFCEKVGGDITKVRLGIGSDKRIGTAFLFPGVGYGGSCFPKDVRALIKTASDIDVPLQVVSAAQKVNLEQRYRFLQKIYSLYSEELSGKQFGLWGLSFKPRTDDMREAPSLTIMEELVKRGAKILAYDPAAMNEAKRRLSKVSWGNSVTLVQDQYDVLNQSDALIIVTEWNDFRDPDFEKIKSRLKSPQTIIDGRNLWDLSKVGKYGFRYLSIGRKNLL
ncbi:MAG: UDP-glucose/GDP-mannose dehydrogenase family protein [bacterium]|nr:UDP-glucose/GDP-mannose dehydrogenase family protein [bacterium]